MCEIATLLLLAVLPVLTGYGSARGASWPDAGVQGTLLSTSTGPAFLARQQTTVVAVLGESTTLDCTVLRLADKSVSWIRSRDLQILSHAGTVFTADTRVSADEKVERGVVTTGDPESLETGGVTRHSLHIDRLRASDAGRYECQVNTEPKMSLFFNLTVLEEAMPRVVVSVDGARERVVEAGGVVTLSCEARYEPPPDDLPLPPLDLRWYKDDRLIDPQVSRGGVSLERERWGARATARLTLGSVRARDAGRYTCACDDIANHVLLRVHRTGQQMEAMQRDGSEQLTAAHINAAPFFLGRCAPLSTAAFAAAVVAIAVALV